jgi:putative transposase
MRPTYNTTRLIDDPREVTRYDLGGHTHYKLDYHFVWRTKFNKRILGRVLTPFLVGQIDSVCVAKKVKRLGLGIAANHVHFCARLRPSQAPAKVMQWIKATTSKNALEHYPQLREQYGIRNLWGRGYHVESLGDKNVFAILAYLGRQDEKHDTGALEDYFSGIDTFLSKVPPDERDEDEDGPGGSG